MEEAECHFSFTEKIPNRAEMHLPLKMSSSPQNTPTQNLLANVVQVPFVSTSDIFSDHLIQYSVSSSDIQRFGTGVQHLTASDKSHFVVVDIVKQL